MSAHRFVTLTCDGCGEVFNHGIHVSVKECRASAANMGWALGWGSDRRREDYCPHCHAKGKGER